jgi:site-specific recombinase XerD
MVIADPALAEHVEWMRLRELSPRTVEQRLTAMRGLVRWAQAPSLMLDAEDLDGWQRFISERTAPASRSSYVSQVRAFYAWALAAGLVDADPSGVLVAPKLHRGKPRPISEEDLALALAQAPARLAPMLELAAYAGLRAAEIAALDRADVLDRQDPALLVVTGKGDKERIVPAASSVITALRWYGMPDRGPVFRREDGHPGRLSGNLVSHLCCEYLHSVGVEATTHQLRHRFLTQIYRETRDIRLTQELAGHESPATTAIYTDWSRERAAAAVAALDSRRSA